MEIRTQEYELNTAVRGIYGSRAGSFFFYSPITSAHGTIRTFRTVITEFFYQYITCSVRNFEISSALKRDRTIVTIIAKFEIYSKMYMKVTKHLLQTLGEILIYIILLNVQLMISLHTVTY